MCHDFLPTLAQWPRPYQSKTKLWVNRNLQPPLAAVQALHYLLKSKRILWSPSSEASMETTAATAMAGFQTER